jgi:glycosyltransferase A (GT-A) superfamily protein (DUF2064 family)
LIVFVDDPDDTDPSLSATLDLARRVGGVGRVLLFHPPDAESRLISRSLGYRLWPQEGESPGQRYANAFRQAADLGYEGSAVITLAAADDLTAERIGEAVTQLQQHHGAIVPDGRGGIATLVLQEPQPTLFSGDELPTYDELVTRASQQRVRLVELPAEESVRR